MRLRMHHQLLLLEFKHSTDPCASSTRKNDFCSSMQNFSTICVKKGSTQI